MSKLEELIQQYCPDGCKHVLVGSICTIEKGQQLNKENLLDEGEYPVINGGINPSGFWNEYNYPENLITISQGGASAGYVNFIEKPFWAGAHCYVISKCESTIDYRYLYHFIKMQQSVFMNKQYGAGIPSLAAKEIKELEVPLPALPVQREIVRILDEFSLLSAELAAELAARKQQYEFYRDELLSFNNGTDTKKLEDIAIIKARIGWQGLTKDEYLSDGDYYLVTGVDFKHGLVDWDNCHYVDEERYNQDKNIQLRNDDVLVTKDGTLGKVAYVRGLSKPATLNSGVFVVRSTDKSVSNRYLYHYLKSPYLMKFANSKLTGGTIKHLNQSVITQLPIPIPSNKEQERIVSILDSFDKIVNDIYEGLPAEIEARQKQYEYYRDKLLTFKRLES